MAQKKGGGSTRNGRDSQPKMLGVKVFGGQKIPAGSTIKTVGSYDNSSANRYNPAPGKEVYWAEQSWDEMFNGWIDYSVDKLDLRLETKASSTESRK